MKDVEIKTIQTYNLKNNNMSPKICVYIPM